ncbi:MAG: leucine-rich repeat domain-containing protein [Bacteroidales bacterium]|nr:leucine-rich repeat domain-containing protein [Bacteroidales bacterium]
MKKIHCFLFIILFAISGIEIKSQTTYIPDDNFLQVLIQMGYGEGVEGNYLPTSNISGVVHLYLPASNVSDLTGIEDFVALMDLKCGFNQLTSLDLSANTALTSLECYNNQLTSLDISNCTALTTLKCNSNQLIDLDLSGCPSLVTLHCSDNQISNLDVSANTALAFFYCSNNQLSNIDLSSNTELTHFRCELNQFLSLDMSNNVILNHLWCSNNQLLSLDLRNGNNANISELNSENNSDLKCIYVDDKTAGFLSNWEKDETAIFVNNENECPTLSLIDFEKQNIVIYPNPTNGLFYIKFLQENIHKMTIFDIRGRIIFELNCVHEIETVDLSLFSNGLYVVMLQSDKGSSFSKIIKE